MAEAKIPDHIDEHARRFIAHSPFLALATADAAGRTDCSPRGDHPGFAKVLDERTLAIPDRPGNKIADSFRNLAENDGIGLLFLIPGIRETLRVNGRAYPTDEPDVLARMRIETKEPQPALVDRIAEDVVSLVLRGAAGPLAPREPGAHIDLALPNWLTRQYSLCGDPADRDSYRIAARYEPLSRGGSEYIHRFLRRGRTLDVSLPRDHFPLVPAPE